MAKSFGYDGVELGCWGDHMDVAKAAVDINYCKSQLKILEDNNLQIFAISNHLAGQLVCDPNDDSRSDGFAPESCAGNPEKKREWAVEAMKKGIEDSLETLSEVGGKVQEAAVEAGYGPTVAASAVKKLVDSVVAYQERSQHIIAEMRKLSTENSKEIREAVEDGKARLARLIEQGATAELAS